MSRHTLKIGPTIIAAGAVCVAIARYTPSDAYSLLVLAFTVAMLAAVAVTVALVTVMAKLRALESHVHYTRVALLALCEDLDEWRGYALDGFTDRVDAVLERSRVDWRAIERGEAPAPSVGLELVRKEDPNA